MNELNTNENCGYSLVGVPCYISVVGKGQRDRKSSLSVCIQM